MSLAGEDVRAFERCIAGGGVAVFPADTIYGLACDPTSTAAVRRLYALKGRPPAKPAAVMFFTLEDAHGALPELGERTRAAVRALLPGGLTLLLANPAHRFPLACGPDPDTLGLRVPDVDVLRAVSLPVLQSSANLSGGPDARTLADVDPQIRAAADLVLDGGALVGTPSTVLDLRAYEDDCCWTVLRDGAVSREAIAGALADAGRVSSPAAGDGRRTPLREPTD